jgi:hypothetical protein
VERQRASWKAEENLDIRRTPTAARLARYEVDVTATRAVIGGVTNQRQRERTPTYR